MAGAVILWGIRLAKGAWEAYKLSPRAANAAIKAGKASGRGRTAWYSNRGAVNAAAKKNPQATKPAAKVKPKVKPKAEEPKVWSDKSSAAGQPVVKTPQVGGTAPWRKAGEFTKLGPAEVSKLSSSQRKIYKTALDTWLKRNKSSKVARQVLKAKETPFGMSGGMKVARYSKAGLMKLGKYPTVRSGLFRIGQGGAAVYTGAQIAEMGYRKATTGKWSDKDGNLLSVIPFSEADWWSWKGGKKGDGNKSPASKTAVKKPQPKTQSQSQTTTTTTTARPASPDEKIQIAKNTHGKYSKQAGVAWGKKHGIDISHDYPGMSADEMQEGLDEGTVSKKLYGKEGKLTQAERDEINERRDMRRGGSISSDSYKLRKKSSKAKSGRASKQTSWNY
jgi:hypothetical protein